MKKALTETTVSAWFSVGGRWRIRTADPLLVRQTLWTSWAKRPKAFAVGIGNLLLLPASLARYLKDSFSLSREVFPLKSDAKVESFFELCKCFAKKFYFFLKNREKTRKITVNTDNAVITDNHSNHWYRIYRTILQNITVRYLADSNNSFIFR